MRTFSTTFLFQYVTLILDTKQFWMASLRFS